VAPDEVQRRIFDGVPALIVGIEIIGGDEGVQRLLGEQQVGSVPGGVCEAAPQP